VDLADHALASEFEPVVCLEAPELAEVPRSLLRADGRSVYQRHGGTRYATGAQLAMEERMVAQARAGGAPSPTRARAAQLLGADLAQLEDTLAGRAHDADARRTRTGLRADQAAAAWSVLTDGRRVSVINAPAGSGKTRVLAEAARIWAQARLGPVIGITASQSARNTLAAAGVPVSYNSAQFLGHLPGRHAARGPVRIGPGSLLVIDEASMISSSCRLPRPGTRPWPTPTTWPSCTPSGSPKPPRPASSNTEPARGRPAIGLSSRTRPPGPVAMADPTRRRTRRARPAQMLADAIAERDLAGARDIPAVLDARIRHRTGSLVPLPPRPWSAQIPAITDPARRAYLAEIASLMDARKDRIGEHAAEHAPPWAVTWPWPPTPNSAAATPASNIRRCAPPNLNPPPIASGPSSPCPSTSRLVRWASGSRTWLPRTARSPSDSPTRRI
jgi:AAA domain-containing protein